MFTILKAPDRRLTSQASAVKKFDKKLKEIIEQMKETLVATRDPVGVGLAAPQVGIPLRMLLMKPKESSPVAVFINPEIVHISEEKSSTVVQSARIQEAKKKGRLPRKRKLLEGCLSLPNIWGYVTRKKELTLSYQDVHGKKHKKEFSGFRAVIIQHELDHLDGILFTKRVMEQGEKLFRSYKNEKGEDEFEEIKV